MMMFTVFASCGVDDESKYNNASSSCGVPLPYTPSILSKVDDISESSIYKPDVDLSPVSLSLSILSPGTIFTPILPFE